MAEKSTDTPKICDQSEESRKLDALAVEAQKSPTSENLSKLYFACEKFIKWYARKNAVERYKESDVEDMTQCGYFAVLSALEKYDAERENGSFLTLLGWRLLKEWRNINYHDRRISQRETSGDAPAYGDEGRTRFETMAAPDVLDCFIETEYKSQLSQEMKKAVDGLPEAEQRMVKYRYYGGLKHDEIARIMNVPMSTVWSRTRRALERLEQAAERGDNGLLQFIEQRTPYFKKVGVASFKSTNTSIVELAVIKREQAEREYRRKMLKGII